MTKRKNYPRLRNEKLEGTGMPPHFIDEKKKEVLFHIPAGMDCKWDVHKAVRKHYRCGD